MTVAEQGTTACGSAAAFSGFTRLARTTNAYNHLNFYSNEGVMKRAISTLRLLAILALLGATGCGKRPFVQYQFCVEDGEGLAQFQNVARRIAEQENMRFVDSSVSTLEFYRILAEDPKSEGFAEPVTVVSVRHEEGWGFMSGNFRHYPYQLTMGFSSRDNFPDAKRFADTVYKELSTYWTVHVVPEGRGAFPLPGCDNGYR